MARSGAIAGRFAAVGLCLLLCVLALLPGAAFAERAPQRIVSLDYCADQYVLRLIDRERIAALSPFATARYSYMREAARGITQIRPQAEDVILTRPDLVVRTYGGGPNIAGFLERAGVPVVQVGYVSTLPDIARVLRDVARALGEPERGEAVIADMEARLAAIAPGEGDLSALYVTPGGVTSGTGTLVDGMLQAAGLTNFETRPGWHALPLERLAHDKPDLVAASFFSALTGEPAPWSAARHAIVRDTLESVPTVPLEGAWTACGSWFIVEAIEALAEAAARLRRERIGEGAP